jgi:uncharacterized protein YukE
MTGGRDLGASLFRLYLGGRTFLPEAANSYADLATALHALTPSIESLATELEHDVGGSFTEALRTVHLALTRTAINLDRAGTALVQIADRYSRTDEAAREEFDGLRRGMRDALEKGPAPFTRPPMPGDRQPDFPPGIVKEA